MLTVRIESSWSIKPLDKITIFSSSGKVNITVLFTSLMPQVLMYQHTAMLFGGFFGKKGKEIMIELGEKNTP